MGRVFAALLAVSAGIFPAGSLFSADWPQWRGPERNGLVPASVPLLDAFPDGGPKKLWESEDLQPAGNGSFGSVSIADGCAYVYLDRGYTVPKEDRVLTKDILSGLGWAPDMPADLSKLVEEARVSEARTKLKNYAEQSPWVTEWLKANIKPETRKFSGAAQARLFAGPNAIPLDLLAKLVPIADKVFPNQAAFDQWFKDNNIDPAAAKEATRRVASTNPACQNFVACLDANTGKTRWKVEVDAKIPSLIASGTPTVVSGRVYFLASDSVVYCLDAKAGKEIWKKKPFAKPADSHCSVLVADGVVVVIGTTTVGLDAQTGDLLWELKNSGAQYPSPVLWKTADKTCVIVQGRQLACLDVKTGKPLWTAPGSGYSTPAVVGDSLALIVGKKLLAYKLSPDKAEKLWELPFPEDYASPVIYKDHVYAVGSAERNGKQGRALCVDLATGKIAWDGVVEGAALCSSPLVADDKLIALAGKQIVLIKASPDQFSLLSKAVVTKDEGFTSPSLADGKVFLRVGNKVVCYDLAKR